MNFYLCLSPMPKILHYVYINILIPGTNIPSSKFLFVSFFLQDRQSLISHADLECPIQLKMALDYWSSCLHF